MKKTSVLVLLFALITVCGTAERLWAGTIDSLILNTEISAANFFGTNARAMAMGQTGIATAQDGSAMIYNPACLARVRRLEVLGGLSHLRLDNTTDYHTGRYQGYTSTVNTGKRNLTKTHLDGLSVAVPVPTYRGSMVFGFGVHRVKNFDRTLQLKLRDEAGNDFIDQKQTETESGGLYAWSAAGAVEVSPRMAVGMGLSVYTGKAEYAARYQESEQTGPNGYSVDETTDIQSDHVGISGSIGFSYQAAPSLTIGVVIESPSWWNIKEDSKITGTEVFDTASSPYYWQSDYGDNSSTEYNLRHPFSLGLGAGFSHRQLTLALDVKYTDWSQMEYTNKFSQDLNAIIQENYREVVAVRLGAEYVFPKPGISLRAGYFTDPLPFPSGYIKKDRKYATFGIGFLIDQVMTIDLAAVLGGYTINYKDPLRYTEEYKTRRVFLTMAYRI